MEADSSETNIVIITKRDRLKLFCKLYWEIIVLIITPIILLPIAFVKDKCAYKCFNIFLVTAVYWLTNVMHPSIISLVPIALYSIMNTMEKDHISQLYIRNELLDCLGVMMIIIAIENSQIHKRLALKILLTFGCSHYRLSFLLFFSTMCLSMWISDILACGIMMPLVKAILMELEKMGILDMFLSTGKAKRKSIRHEERATRPTDFTVFYFLGIAYSSSIGGMGTLIGSQVNQIFKTYCEIIFPEGPKIEFPHFMLLNLPGVLLIETLMYLWMNSYFLGMFRAQSSIALEIGISEEESQYIKTLLARQYQQLGKIKYQEFVMGIVVIITGLLQATMNATCIGQSKATDIHSHIKTAAPCFISVILLFLIPANPYFPKYFKKRADSTVSLSLPKPPNKACLNWSLCLENINWSVLFTIGGSCFVLETLKDSYMTMEFEKFLLLFKNWPPEAVVLIVILFCKIFTEFASNQCVAYCLFPTIARVSTLSNLNPHYLMMAATLSCSLPFHLSTGSPTNAMVAAYVRIPPRKMMLTGIGPSIISLVVTWFTVCIWSKAIWTDIHLDPEWADANTLVQK